MEIGWKLFFKISFIWLVTENALLFLSQIQFLGHLQMLLFGWFDPVELRKPPLAKLYLPGLIPMWALNHEIVEDFLERNSLRLS